MSFQFSLKTSPILPDRPPWLSESWGPVLAKLTGVKRIAVLGSTGSIGTQTLDIVRQHPDRLEVVGLVANRSATDLLAQAQEFGVRNIALMDETAARQHVLPGGMEAVCDVATLAEADMVVVAVSGVIGLRPTILAIEAGKDIALASKEVLVAAGQVVMPLAAKHGVTLTPIDSEHSALFQCLQGYEPSQVDKLILTASGGPFRGKLRGDLASVTKEQVLAHPTWTMGGKITVDSATLMNKGLEVIEAHWLFGTAINQVEVVVHPQSIIHSMVQFKDTSILAQLGWPDMRLPIQYALLYPERKPNALKPWNPIETPTLTFENPDLETFRCLALAYEAAAKGGTSPCALNAANEEAANAFLKDAVGFLEIADINEQVLSAHDAVEPSLENLLETDRWARATAREKMGLKN
ncbi:MAG: 1-deoxy-D-xylulose-5-phosphate reductoisomerase [Fimbriimonadaceae bacterium]|nr:1-deoxy-D-xylulose-5-phosphate reductoisomerase [Fimbriimonadaceae bacterium]